MNNLANGAAQQNLSPVRTGKVINLFPSDELIADFEKAVNPVLYKITLLNKSIIAASLSRDRLLPKLMSGEIVV